MSEGQEASSAAGEGACLLFVPAARRLRSPHERALARAVLEGTATDPFARAFTAALTTLIALNVLAVILETVPLLE
jgi:hypothetical protein